MKHTIRTAFFVLTLPISSAFAQTSFSFSCYTISPGGGVLASTGETFTEEVYLDVSGTVPCGTYRARIYPSWGGTILGSSQTFTSGDAYYESVASITAPCEAGTYSYGVTCVASLCDGRVIEAPFVTGVDLVVTGSTCYSNSVGDPEDDIRVSDHDFTGNYLVGEEVCGEVELRNNGIVTYEIDRTELDADWVSVGWADDTDASDFRLTPDDEDWIGDPFCFTPLEAGELRLQVRVKLEGSSTRYLVDNIYVDIIEPDLPCTCDDYCSGSYRYWGGVPVASGSTCSCSYVSSNCNAMDLTGSEALYCSGGNVRGHRSLTDYNCSSGSCLSFGTSWTSDRLVESCGGRGCVTTGGVRCNSPDSCAGVVCGSYCAGSIRYWGGTCVVSGASYSCSYVTSDCNTMDTTGMRQRYCSAGDVYSRQLFTNYGCSIGMCTVTSESWTENRFEESCGGWGCSTSSGATCNSPAVEVSETVIDPETGLVWMQSAALSTMNLETAIGYCDELEFADRSDWRLPTIDELRTLISGCARNEADGACLVSDPSCTAMSCWSWANCLACSDFRGPGEAGCYWLPDTWSGSCGWYASASRVAGTPSGQWVVGFHRGHPSDGGTGGVYAVRCVTDDEPPDPCVGVRCDDYCDGSLRYWGGVPVASGSTCSCSYVSSDCNAMDITDESIGEICVGDELRERFSSTDYSCNAGTAQCLSTSSTRTELVEDCRLRETERVELGRTCEDGAVMREDRVSYWSCFYPECAEGWNTERAIVEVCPFGCADGACLPCIPVWDCTEWSDCNGPAEQSRACADQNECGSSDGQPVLGATCPCELADAYWAMTYAEDGDTVELVVETHGECLGRSLYLEIQETDGTLLDSLLSLGLEGSFVIEIDPEGMTSHPWTVTFTDDWGGISEYLFRADLVGADGVIQSNNVIEVEPRSISLGTVGSLLEEFPLPVEPCLDYGVTTLSSACIAEREAAGVYGYEEPRWVEILEEIFEWIGWAYLADCGVCVGTVVAPRAIMRLCPASGALIGACTSLISSLLSTSIVTCDLCLGGGPSASAAARRAAAPEVRTATMQIGAETRQLELAREAAEIQYVGNGVRLTYERAGVPIVEELVLDQTMALRGIKYEAPPWPYPGDIAFLSFRTSNPLLPIDYSSLQQGHAAKEDIRFTISLFVDEVFSQRANEIVTILGRGEYTLLDVHTGIVTGEVGGIKFITDVDGLPTLYAGALPATGEMRIMVGSLREAVEAGNTALIQIFFDTILPHEYGHLTMWKFVSRLPDPIRGGYYQRNILTTGPYRWNQHAEEYLSDRLVMESLGEVDIELLARYQNGILSQVEATVGSNRDRWIRTWVTRRTELTFDYQWQMLRFYNLARDLELTLARTMLANLRRFARRNLSRREASESVREFIRLADELREDGGTFAREVQEESGSATVLDTVLRRYNLVVPPVE